MKSQRNNRLKDYNKCSKKNCEKIISEKKLNKMFKLSKYNKDYWRLRSKKDKCIAKQCTHLIKGQLKGKNIKPTKKELSNFRNMFKKS